MTFSLKNIDEAAIHVLNNARHPVIVFYGDMGAGKTTLIKAICNQLKCIQTASSPTFSLVNEYTTEDGNTVYHFDFYRIRDIDEVYDMGYEDYLYSGHMCLIEWPEKISELLPGVMHTEVRLHVLNDSLRELSLNNR